MENNGGRRGGLGRGEPLRSREHFLTCRTLFRGRETSRGTYLMPVGLASPAPVERREAKGFWGWLSTTVSVMNSDLEERRSRVTPGMVNLHLHLDEIYSHLRDTTLGISERVFLKRLNLGRPTLNVWSSRPA